MDYAQNPFFQNTYIERIGDNLIKAFNDDGRGAVNQSHKRLLDAQTEKQVGENRGREATAGAIAGQDFSGPIANQFWSNLAANAIRSGRDPAEVARATMFLRSNSGASDSDIARAVVGAKGGIGTDEGVSLGDRNAISQKKEDAAFGRTKYSADSSAGATIGAANIHERGANERAKMQDDRAIAYQFGDPDPNNPAAPPPVRAVTKRDLLANPNNRPVLPNSYYEKGVDKEGNRAFGLPGAGGITPLPDKDRFVVSPDGKGGYTYQQVAPGVPAVDPHPPSKDRFVTAFDPNSPTGQSRQEDRPGVPVPKAEKQPHVVSERAVGQIETDALASLGMWDDASKGPNAAFAKQYAQQMEDARITAAEVMQATGNAGKAQQAYLAKLGIKPGSDVSTPGGIARLFGAKNVEVTPPIGTQQAAPKISEQFAPPPQAPAGAPAASASLPPPPADPAKRVIGQAYPTPKGVMIWTAHGWMPQQNANDGAR